MSVNDRLHRWLALGANVGILIGLVLVIVQIRQSTQLARSTYRSQGNDVANQSMATCWDGHGGDGDREFVRCHRSTLQDFNGARRVSVHGIKHDFRDYQLAQQGCIPKRTGS
jgi:hypothetical protein